MYTRLHKAILCSVVISMPVHHAEDQGLTFNLEIIYLILFQAAILDLIWQEIRIGKTFRPWIVALSGWRRIVKVKIR